MLKRFHDLPLQLHPWIKIIKGASQVPESDVENLKNSPEGKHLTACY